MDAFFLIFSDIKTTIIIKETFNEKGFKESPGIGFGCTQDRPGRRV
jgi:hypothetical protein